MEWYIESGKDDAGKSWYIARVLVRLPKRAVISVIENLDCTKIANSVTDVVLQEVTPAATPATPPARDSTADVKAAASDTLEAELERVRDYTLEELRNQ